MKRLRLSVYATLDEHRRIVARAHRHDVSTSRYLLMSALGEPRSPAAARDAEAWWSGLSSTRKRQIHRFLAKQMTAPECPGSQPLPFEVEIDVSP